MEIPIGTKVIYHPIIKKGVGIGSKETKTRSKPWQLGHGEWVVKVEGKTGCVAVSHITIIDSTTTPPKGSE